MFTHRTSTPGRVGTNDGYGVDASFGLYQNLRVDTYLAKTRTFGRSGDDLSYRGFVDYNADRLGLQIERLVVEPNFLPEVGFLRRTDMRRNFALGRYSLRPRGVRGLRRLTFQSSLNYVTNNANRLDTRELAGFWQTEFTNSDLLGLRVIDSFERLVRPFDVYPGRRIPVGAYDFHTVQLSYGAGQQRRVSGDVLYEAGSFYNGERQSLGVSAARVQVTPQVSLEPSASVNIIALGDQRFTATVVRTRATYTVTPRMFVSGIVQYNSSNASSGSNLRLRWEYAPGSELFVVYTDDYDTDAVVGRPTLRNRAFVVKVNRLFRP
jgi:hypothetical protein